jgi:hypothetical protein
LNSGCARQSKSFIITQSFGHVSAITACQHCRQCRSILDGLSRALSHERQHGVTGIAQQCDPANRPARQGWSVEQRPNEHFVRALEYPAHLQLRRAREGLHAGAPIQLRLTHQRARHASQNLEVSKYWGPAPPVPFRPKRLSRRPHLLSPSFLVVLSDRVSPRSFC